MRLATIASIAIVAVSSAALAQVASAPVEQKPGRGNVVQPAKNADGTGDAAMSPANNVTAPDNTTATPTPAPTPRRR